MGTRVVVEALYRGDADQIFDNALNTQELADAMKGLAQYDGLPSGPVAQGDTYTVHVTLWGVLTVRDHVMHLETLNRADRWLQSRERSPQIDRWDHHLSVQPDGDMVRWTDSIVVDAGWRTFGAARFASFVYQRRHRYRKSLGVTARLEKERA